MKRAPLLGLAALVVLSFGLSAALVAGAVSLWGPSARAGAVLARVAGRLAFGDRCPAVAAPSLPSIAAVASTSGMAFDDSDEHPWALVEPRPDGSMTNEIWGRFPDLDALTRNDRRPLLWFVRDGDQWVSRDPSVIARARKIVEPMRRIGREMGEVGRKMGARGAALGRLGGRLGALGGRLAALETRAALVEDDADRRAELRREARAIREEMDALSARMHDGDNAEDGGLRGRMRALERRQRAAVREAQRSMRSLIEDAVRERRAERLGTDI